MHPGRRLFVVGAASSVAVASAHALAQSMRRVPRVAVVAGSTPTSDMESNYGTRAFFEALRELGLIDGRNVIVERRSAEGRIDQLPALMQQVVQLHVDVIVTFGRPGVTAALAATDRIPIVGVVDNVIDAGLSESLARPSRNLTGVSENHPELEGKRLQLLREAAPTISRVAVIKYRSLPATPQSRIEIEAAARAMRVDIVWLGVDAAEELDTAFATIVRERANAVYASGTHVNFVNARRIADFALKQRLPSFGFPREGMLMTYEADWRETLRRAAALVKRILDGAKPSELPFEQPTKFELIINLKTARALGLTIPQSLRDRATELISE